MKNNFSNRTSSRFPYGFRRKAGRKNKKSTRIAPELKGAARAILRILVQSPTPKIMHLTEEGPLTALHHEVLSYEIDFRKKLRLAALLNLFQELANQNAERLGFGFEKLMAERCFWALSRLRVEVEALPHWTDKVVIKTWPRGVEGLFARRDWLLETADGQVMARCTSAWLLVDLDRRRPLRIAQRLPGFEFANDHRAIDHELPRLEPSAQGEQVWQHTVRYADLDQNRHVNNVRYVDWMMNAFGIEEHEQHEVKSFEINIHAEAQEGDEVQVTREKQEEGWLLAIHKAGGQLSAIAALKWN